MTTISEAALILAPQGRDAHVACRLLRERRIDCETCASVEALVEGLTAGAGFAIVTEDAIATADLKPLSRWLNAQADWSDFPFILLTRRGGLERNPAAGRYLEALGNVTFLERPFHPTSLMSLAQAALRARRRQYDARARLEAIRLGEQRMTVALAAGRLGNWTLDSATGQLDASGECKAHYGRGRGDDFTYQDLRASVHPEDAGRMQAAVARSQETGDDYDIEYRCLWPDNSVHWVSVNGRVEWGASGQMLRMTGVSQDITERRAAEETLRAFATELEARVDERTRENELVSAQLHEAQKLETIGQLTGGVAHDFNNLLTPIMSAIELTQRRLGRSDDRLTQLLDNAMQAAERAKTLVQRLLGFARRIALETVPVDLEALLMGISGLIRTSIGSTVTLRIDVAPGLPHVLADDNQLELALLNLCINARDAMPQGGTLTLTVAPANGERPSELAPGDYLRLSVGDTGTGMSAETMRRSVEPFYSTKEVGRGTGLGLSMVHGLASQLGGTLTLESVLGEGTCATIWLPVTSRPSEAARQAVPVDATGPSESRTVLVVDDEFLVRMGTAEMIRELGHDVTEASGGGEALAQLDAGLRPDIVLTDYKMPGMDGAELIRQLRVRDPALPVLLVTGYGGDGAEDGIPRLSKPFSQAEIAAALSKALS